MDKDKKILLGVGAAIAGLALILRAKGAPPEAPPGKAILSIDTTPVKGEVFINGISVDIAPISVELDPGTYILSFGVVSGYITPGDISISLLAGQSEERIVVYEEEGVPPSGYNFITLSGGEGLGYFLINPKSSPGGLIGEHFGPGTYWKEAWRGYWIYVYPLPGYTRAGWTITIINCLEILPDGTPSEYYPGQVITQGGAMAFYVEPSMDCEIEVRFETLSYQVIIKERSGGITEPPAGTYSVPGNQDSFLITAYPNSGYYFLWWSLFGLCVYDPSGRGRAQYTRGNPINLLAYLVPPSSSGISTRVDVTPIFQWGTPWWPT